MHGDSMTDELTLSEELRRIAVLCSSCRLNATSHGITIAAATLREAACELEQVSEERNALKVALDGYLGDIDRMEREKAEIAALKAAKLRVLKLIEQNGCDCECEHHLEEHDDDCERCLACSIEKAINEP